MTDENTPIPAGTSGNAATGPNAAGTPPAATPPNPVVPPVEGEAPAAPAPAEGGEDQAVLQKRLKGAISEVEKKNADYARAVEVQANLVQSDPSIIHKIADADLTMANRIIEKVWGQHGVKTYKQLQERIELEELKEKDPAAYESKKEVLDIKERLEKRDRKDRENIASQFFNSKGIRHNEYDPNYQKIQDALNNINPSIVAEDYAKALELAHAIAFGQRQPNEDVDPSSVQYGVGAPPSLPNQVQHSSETNWLVGRLRQRGHKVQLS